MAEALNTEGLIDPLELFEVNEMADAAHWHAVEELQCSLSQYRGASTYDVAQLDNRNSPLSRVTSNCDSDLALNAYRRLLGTGSALLRIPACNPFLLGRVRLNACA